MSLSSRQERGLVAVVALLIGLGVAWVSWGGQSVGGRCVWTSGFDVAEGDRFLRGWIADAKGPALREWNVTLGDNRAQLDLSTAGSSYQVLLSLGAACWTPPSAQLVSGRRAASGFPTGQALRVLAEGFPGPKLQLNATNRAGRVIAALLIVTACLGVGIATSTAPPARSPLAAARDGAWVLLLVGLAAWPILCAPFDTDAPVLRAAFAAVDVFGDWNHPFLPYLFNRPTTWFSLEPWALRLVPLAFLALETGLLMCTTRRAGGTAAGALAVVWFVCEIRRRHGLVDLSDWDVAGTFLMAILLAVQRRERIGWGTAAFISGCMAAGVLSSWLMIVVAGVLAGCLGLEALRGRCTPACAVAVGVVFGALATRSLGVFAAGTQQVPMVTLAELWRQMYDETPLGRTLTMSLPIALGITWLARRSARLDTRFVALTLVALPVALSVANQRSHVNGGYYIGLVTPLLLYAAALGTTDALAALVSRAGRYGTPLLRPVLVLAVAVATIGGLGNGESGVGAEQLQILAHQTRLDLLPVFTNSEDLPHLLAFERARAGEGPIADVIVGGGADLQTRVHRLEGDVCAPGSGTEAAGFYLVYLDAADREARRACVERLGTRCRDVGPAQTVGQRTNWVLRCDSPP